MNHKEKNSFPKNFFENLHKHEEEKSSSEDMIPFKWNKHVLDGKTKVIVTREKKVS